MRREEGKVDWEVIERGNHARDKRACPYPVGRPAMPLQRNTSSQEEELVLAGRVQTSSSAGGNRRMDKVSQKASICANPYALLYMVIPQIMQPMSASTRSAKVTFRSGFD
ncbi:hypothetical protein CU103_24995 [Phyllobacterium sophorae]|uniref:Uncharacterized protein n=1 Tax=Phyllobacterium sophorae TaxID=1520277 RepID=A0A2P7B2Z7_9HYPH|nr:hypothetical protein CU103_24995 [Phyllobacterium sophorae]